MYADITLLLSRKSSIEEINETLMNFQKTQKWEILQLIDDPLVSLDFVKNRHSAVVDKRWTSLSGDLLKLVLWYDNESGYALRVLDQVRLLNDQN